jgi:hypothetical protein
VHLDLVRPCSRSSACGASSRGIDLVSGTLSPRRTLPQFLRGELGATDGTHRLIVADGRAQLFDVTADPREEHDLAPGLGTACARSRAPPRLRAPAAADRRRRSRRTTAPTSRVNALGYGGEGRRGEDAED